MTTFMMTSRFAPLASIILAAGKGTRMVSDLPKVVHPVGNWPMVKHVLNLTASLDVASQVVVCGHGAEKVQAVIGDIPTALQTEQLGTAHAVLQALPALENHSGDVVILYADTPLVTPETITRMQQERTKGASVVVLGFEADNPTGYGRLVTCDKTGSLQAIVEEKEANDAIKAIKLCNSGVILADMAFIRDALPKIKNDNLKGEYYLTDIVALAVEAGKDCRVVKCAETEVLGVNSRVELAQAERLFQEKKRLEFMKKGVTLLDPQTTYFSADTKIDGDVMIGQNVVFGLGVHVKKGAEILPFSMIEGAVIESGAIVGPFARIRPDTVIGENAKVGNFVEIKKSTLAKGAKVNHLSYIGDATLGEKVNVGAGTITCNYDGYNKSKTIIKDGAFIGSNTLLVAPVTVGERAYTASGTTVTSDVPADSLGIGRSPLVVVDEWAVRYRAKKAKA